jgi:vacuolar-type H+-ATPase catalytic subunit A/Vma1
LSFFSLAPQTMALTRQKAEFRATRWLMPLAVLPFCAGGYASLAFSARRRKISMFKAQQYHEQATKYGERVRNAVNTDERRKYQDLADRFVELSNNERDLAATYHDAVDEAHRSCEEVLAAEEEQVLRCLGAALIMQWETLPASLQRELFDTAGSVGKLLETVDLRAQIARFLHKHKTEASHVNLPLA